MRILLSVALVSALVAGCKKEDKPAPGTAVAPATAPAAPAQPVMPGMAAAPPAAQPGQPPQNLGQALANLQKLGQQMGGQPGAVDPQNPGAALGAAMQQLGNLGKAMGAGQAAGAVVNWKVLEPFVPEKMGDWVASGQLRGETSSAMGMQVSRVKRRYKKGEASLSVEVVDTNASPLMRMGINMASNLNIDGTDGVKKGITVNGAKGLLEWRRAGNSGKLTMLVGERYLVSMRLRPAANADEVQAIAGVFNTAGLAAVK